MPSQTSRLSTEKDIIVFYNARGESEKNFDIQNNDFRWAHLPFPSWQRT